MILLLFKVINAEGNTVMCTESKSCIPDPEQLVYMSKCGYKFRYEDKAITVAKLAEQVKTAPATKNKRKPKALF